jgi:hypothetical protein
VNQGSRTARWVVGLGIALALTGRTAGAVSLADRLHRFIDRNGFPTFGEFNEAVTPIVERLALRGIDLPATATTPAFTYEFDFEAGVPVRTSQSLGPTFADRAETVGRHRFAIGVSHLYADLDHFDGHDFADDIVTAGIRSLGTLQIGGGFAADDFSLESHITSVSATFGLTAAWDVNVLLPIVQTSLAVDGTSVAIAQQGSVRTEISAHVGFEDGAVGLGDVLVRTKLRVVDADLARVALGLAVRTPTGNPKDFQGLGDSIVTPSVIVSRAFGRHDVHLNLGVDCNADDLERTRARYALGASIQPWERLAFLFDVIGSSSFTDDEFTFPAAVGSIRQLFGNDALIRSVTRDTVTAFVPRSDVVDFAFGVKTNPIGSLVGYVTAIVPLTRDGLRAEVIPSAGIEWSF